MKLVALDFAYYINIISVPDHIADHIQHYQQKFDSWLFDKANDHGYWVIINGKKEAVSFGTNAFLDYLNSYEISPNDEKATLFQEEVSEHPQDIPCIYF